MPADFIGKIVLVETIKASIKELIAEFKKEKIPQEKRERLSDALASIQLASIETRIVIDNNGYEPNLDLAKLWNTALKKAIDAELKELPDYLNSKSKFWGQPQDWLNEPTSMELVPKLNYLNDKCDMLLIELKK
ncbi:hypothetical protein [Maribacter ulvicola]|uniref:Uncharacterized protein n=1 Tax=Maribacter ulvicola TaxID=228959 RepID=A0A1N7AUA6_9FLAO|nr:hypothetical protein [Maribacter ulvicola]SIR42700.1 hypothetical protein SAMN05421797_11521 [Maribacter ulvicola]